MKHSNNLHKLRIKNNLSQSEISKHLKISQGLYCRMERGSVNPSKYLSKLTELLKAKPNEIYNQNEHAEIADVLHAEIPQQLPVFGMPTIDGKGVYISNKFASTTERPDYLKESPNAYACFVVGNYMQPRFNHGELIYVDPSKKVVMEDEVLISTFNKDQEFAEIKCLISEEDNHFLCGTFDSDETTKYNKNDIGRLHSIVGMRKIY